MDIKTRKSCFEQYFPISYPFDMDGLDMTCSDFVNVLKMLTCFEKHPVSRVTMAIQKSGNR